MHRVPSTIYPGRARSVRGRGRVDLLTMRERETFNPAAQEEHTMEHSVREYFWSCACGWFNVAHPERCTNCGEAQPERAAGHPN